MDHFDSVHDASLLDSLDKSDAHSVVRDRQAESVFRLGDFHLLLGSLPVDENLPIHIILPFILIHHRKDEGPNSSYEIIEAELSTEKIVHVDAVRVQSAKQNLRR